VGKTYILKQFIASLLEEDVNCRQIFYLYLEDQNIPSNVDYKFLFEIFNYYLKNFVKSNEKIYIFLDEIQNVKDRYRFVKNVFEKR
jgi:predicted AAA+ superfamily ATPase